jgi:hypothetical protein
MKRFPLTLIALACLSLFLTPSTLAQEDDDIVGEIKKQREGDKPKPDKPAATKKEPGESDAEPDAVAPEDGLVLKGSRVQLPSIPEASWCAGGWNLLEVDGTAELPGLTMKRTAKGVQLTGQFKETKAARKRQAYRPSTFSVSVVDGVEQPIVKELKSRDLAKGTDVEIPGADLRGRVVIRIEETWRGVVWGVITGYEFKLENENVTLVDADFDGRCSDSDRLIYGERNLWMPWHTVTCSGDTIYYELTVANSHTLTARTKKMASRGDDEAVWAAWQDERKNQGVPPGLFSQKGQAACVKHAEYLKTNKTFGHEENPNLPGYSKEGHDAGMSCCIGPSAKWALWGFLDSLYHRPQIINPESVVLQLGGNDYAYLMGYTTDPDLPTETRNADTQIHPAPGGTVPHGAYSQENPTHPILSSSKAPGLPVIVRVPQYDPKFSGVDCHLYEVTGEKRGVEVRCHLCHAGKDAPQDFPTLWGMVALTPYAVLKPGIYEASFAYTEGGTAHSYVWRFTLG